MLNLKNMKYPPVKISFFFMSAVIMFWCTTIYKWICQNKVHSQICEITVRGGHH